MAPSIQRYSNLRLSMSTLSKLSFNSSALLIASSTALTFSKSSAANNPLTLSQASAFLNSGLTYLRLSSPLVSFKVISLNSLGISIFLFL